MNIKAISTWNCWLTPFDSKRFFERPDEVREFNDNQIRSLLDLPRLSESKTNNDCTNTGNIDRSNSKTNRNVNDRLIVSTFQEAFTFNAFCCMKSMSNCCICDCKLCYNKIKINNNKCNSIQFVRH